MRTALRTVLFGARFTPPRIAGLQLWLDASRADSFSTNYAARVATVTGASGTKALTLSGADTLLEAGMGIRLAGADAYTINTVSGTAVTTVQSLGANYSASALAVSCASQWNDLSGNGRNAAQSTASLQPALVAGRGNGLQVLKFLAAETPYIDIATIVVAQPLTVFCVFNMAGRYVFDDTDGTSRVACGLGIGTAIGAVSAFAGGTAIEDTVSVANTWLVYQATINGASSSVFGNSATAAVSGNPGANNMASMRIGARFTAANSLSGYLGELLVYRGALAAPDYLRVQRYLKLKWGVSY